MIKNTVLPLIILSLATVLAFAGYKALPMALDTESRSPNAIHPMYISQAPNYWRAEYPDVIPSFESIYKEYTVMSSPKRDLGIDMSDLKLIHKSGKKGFELKPNGYSYNLVVFYDCGTRYISVEDSKRNGETTASAKERYAPTPWPKETEAGMQGYFGSRLQITYACLTDKHPSTEYMVLDPKLPNGRTVNEYLNSKIDVVGYQLDTMKHYVLMIDPDGYLIEWNTNENMVQTMLWDLTRFIGQPESMEHVFAFGGAWFGFGKPQHLVSVHSTPSFLA